MSQNLNFNILGDKLSNGRNIVINARVHAAKVADEPMPEVERKVFRDIAERLATIESLLGSYARLSYRMAGNEKGLNNVK